MGSHIYPRKKEPIIASGFFVKFFGETPLSAGEGDVRGMRIQVSRLKGKKE